VYSEENTYTNDRHVHVLRTRVVVHDRSYTYHVHDPAGLDRPYLDVAAERRGGEERGAEGRGGED
jgi:hypothetical protein